MSEQPTPTTEAPATEAPKPAPPEQPAEQPSDPKPTETVEFWKQKAREQEARAKSNADAARRLADLEESQKSEAQKIADRAAAAERARDDAMADGLRYKAAAKHGVSEDYFDMLGTGDEETIFARGERLGGLIKAQAENETLRAELEALRAGKPAPTTFRPTEALRPGATPEPVQPPKDDSYPAHWLPQRQQ